MVLVAALDAGVPQAEPARQLDVMTEHQRVLKRRAVAATEGARAEQAGLHRPERPGRRRRVGGGAERDQ